MLKLIQLEWRKNNIGKYIRNAMILAGVLCLFLFALAYLGIANDPDTGLSLIHILKPGGSFKRPSRLFLCVLLRSQIIMIV